MNRARWVSWLVVTASSGLQVSCHDACEPKLCLGDDCEPSLDVSLKEGQAIFVRYSLPAGVEVDDDERVRFRIETPCACVTFERSPVVGDDIEAVDPAACAFEPALELPVVVPKGGACQLTVTAELLNDNRSITVRGGGKCTDLDCASDVKCTGDLAGEGGVTNP